MIVYCSKDATNVNKKADFLHRLRINRDLLGIIQFLVDGPLLISLKIVWLNSVLLGVGEVDDLTLLVKLHVTNWTNAVIISFIKVDVLDREEKKLIVVFRLLLLNHLKLDQETFWG